MSSILIFLYNLPPAGHILFDPTEGCGEFEVGYSLDTVFRGHGLARRAIELAIVDHAGSTYVTRYRATVKESNLASLKTLYSLGFRDETVLDKGVIRLVLEISNEGGFNSY